MREAELRQVATCHVCRQPFGASGLPMFWRVRLIRFGVDAGAIQRQTGFAQMLGGNAALAMVMGADEDMASPIGDPVEITVCETCAGGRRPSIYELALRGS